MYTFRERRSGKVSGGPGNGVAPSRVDTELESYFLACLEDDNRDVRAGAATALGKLGRNNETVRAGLQRAMADRYAEVREAAVLALGMVRAVTTTPRVRKILLDRREDKGMRVFSAVSLGLMGEEANLPCLERITRDTDEKSDVRAAAILALGLIGNDRGAWTLLPILLGNGNEAYQAFAVSALAKIGKRSLRFRSGRREASIDLVQLFERQLVRKTTRTEVRRALALALGSFGDETTSIDALERAYKYDRDEGVKGFALLSLARLRKDAGRRHGADEFLCRAVRSERDAVVRGFATLAAALNGGVEAAPCLLDVFLRDGHPDVRAAAALGLGLLKHQPALPHLGREVENPRTGGEARGFACVAIGLIGGREAVPYLRSIIEEVEVPYLKWAASTGMALMGDRSVIPTILQRTGDRNQVTRRAMVHSLQYFRDPSTVRPLIELSRRERNEQVRLLIVMTLGAIGDASKGIPVLRRIDKDVNWKAAERVHEIVHVLRLF
jgi:HEAT repeat protein